MPEAWILQSKLTPPARPDGWLERAAIAPAIPAPPVTLLVAGPGYGKTLGLLALATAAGATTLWLGLDELDADPATFFHYLVASMRCHIPRFGDDVLALLAGDAADARRLWRQFFQALAGYNLTDFRLALDDAHHLLAGDGAILEALGYFLDKLPPGCRVLASSRTRLPFPTGRLQARGGLVLLDQTCLAFTPDEQRAFLASRGTPEVPDELLELLDGWPLGLALAAVRPTAAAGLRAAGQGLQALTAYVAEELYLSQPPARRAFMLRAALLQEPTAEACRAVFGADDAASQLEELERHQLAFALAPVWSAGPPAGTGPLREPGYHLPAYLREFLRAEAARQLGGQELATCHGRAATFYEGRGQVELALPHRLAARDWPAAVRAAAACFPGMRHGGRIARVRRWLAAFPPEVAGREPLLGLWRGHVLADEGRHDEAWVAYMEAHEGPGTADPADAFMLAARLANLALLREDAASYARFLADARAVEAHGRPADRADLALVLAMAAEQRGDLATMIAENERALGIPIAGNIEIAASHCIALMNLYTAYLHRGDLARARGATGRLREVAEAWAFYPYQLAARFLEAYLAMQIGEFESVGAFLRTLPPGWGDQLHWHDHACGLVVVGQHHQHVGAWKEAEEAFAAAAALFARAGFRIGRQFVLERELWLALQRRQPARAFALARTAGEPAPEALVGGAATVYDLAVVIPLARAAQMEGDAQRARMLLEAALPQLEALGAALHRTRARLYLAAACLAAGDRPTAVTQLATASREAGVAGYRFLWQQDQGLWEELAPLADVPPAAEAVRAPAEPTATVAQGVASAPEGGAGRLEIRCFGGFEVRLDGVLLDQWPRRKARLMLAALVLRPAGLRHIELAEILTPGEPGSSAMTISKVALSALRRQFEPDLVKGERSRFVPQLEDRFVLAADRLAAVDVHEFEAAMREAERARAGDPAAAASAYARALGVYRGNLLEDALFEAHFVPEREAFRQQALGAARWLAEHHRQAGRLDEATAVLRAAVGWAPCEEELYIEIMRLARLQGRAELLRQCYWDCRKALKAHLDLAPSEEFEEAYRAIAATSARGTLAV